MKRMVGLVNEVRKVWLDHDKSCDFIRELIRNKIIAYLEVK